MVRQNLLSKIQQFFPSPDANPPPFCDPERRRLWNSFGASWEPLWAALGASRRDFGVGVGGEREFVKSYLEVSMAFLGPAWADLVKNWVPETNLDLVEQMSKN